MIPKRRGYHILIFLLHIKIMVHILVTNMMEKNISSIIKITIQKLIIQLISILVVSRRPM